MSKVKNISKNDTKENAKEANRQNSNYELFEKIEVEDTPFTVIVNNELMTCFGVMGKYRLTEDKKDINEVIGELEKITWNRIIQVILILTELNNKKQ